MIFANIKNHKISFFQTHNLEVIYPKPICPQREKSSYNKFATAFFVRLHKGFETRGGGADSWCYYVLFPTVTFD